MRTPRSHLALAAMLACAPLAACGASGDRASNHDVTPSSTTSTASAPNATPATSHIRSKAASSTRKRAAAGSSPARNRSAAAAFAAAYAQFLDGHRSADTLPDTTGTARAQVLVGGPIPRADRRGSLQVVSLRPAAGSAGVWVLSARDRAHTFYASITVGAGARVVGVQPPDYLQVLARSAPPPPPPPVGSQAPEQAARGFLAGYLAWQYGQGSVRAIRDLTGGLRASLAANPPRVPPAVQGLHPQVTAIAMHPVRAGWQALPAVVDGQQSYELVLTLRQAAGRWLVSTVGLPR